MKRTALHWCDRSLLTGPFYAVCTSPEDFKRELKRLKVARDGRPSFITSSHTHATTHHFENGDRVTAIVCLSNVEGRLLVEVVGLLAHEAMHIWREFCRRIGEHSPAAEQEAYAVQWITQQLIESWAMQDKRGRPLMKKA